MRLGFFYLACAAACVGAAYTPSSRSSFTGNKLFTADGNLDQSFKNSLSREEKEAADKIERMGKEVFNLTKTFSDDSAPEDVEFFLQESIGMDHRGFDELLSNPERVQFETLLKIPSSVYLAMNETTFNDRAGRANRPVKAQMCRYLADENADFETTLLFVKAIDCSVLMKGCIKGTLAEAIAEKEIEKADPSTWDKTKWEESIDKCWMTAMSKTQIDKVPATVVSKKAAMVDRMMADLVGDKKDAVINKLKTGMGGFKNMNTSSFGAMASMMKDLPLKDLRDMDASVITANLATVKEQAKSMDPAQRRQMKKSIKAGLGDRPGNWSGADVVNSALLIAKDKTLVDKLDKSTVVNNIRDIGSQKFDRKSAQSFVRKLKEDSNYDDPSDFDATKVQNVGNLLPGFSKRFIKNMTNCNFDTVLSSGSFKEIDFSKDTARAVIEKLKTDSGLTNGNFDQSRLENLGKAIVGLRSSEIKNIDGNALAGALDNLNDTIVEVIDEMDKTAVNSMIEKLETSSGGLGAVLEKMGPVLQKVPVAKLKNMSSADFGDMSGETDRNFNCGKDTCAVLYQKTRDELGQPGLQNPNYTLPRFQKLKKVMCGMPLDDIKALPPVRSLKDIIGTLVEQDCLSDKQQRVLAEILKYILGVGETRLKLTIRSQDITKYGGILKHFSTDELKKLGTNFCRDIVLMLGKQDLSNVRKEQIQSMASFAQECFNKQTGPLSSDDLSAAGDLVCGLGADRIADIDTDAMEDAVYTVQTRCPMLGSSERQQWKEKAMDKLNVTRDGLANVDDVKLSQVGTLMDQMTEDELNSIPDDVMQSVGPDLAQQFEEKDKLLKKRDEEGYGVDVAEADRTTSDEGKKRTFTKLLTSMINSYSSPSGRRKRSASSLTCSDLQTLSSAVTSLTTSQISSLSSSTFLDCAQFLGSQTEWTTDQISALVTVAKRSDVFGTVTGWTADNLYDSGKIAQGLTSSELESLTQMTTDAMNSIGQYSGWSEAQLSSGFSRWLNLVQSNSASSISSGDLIALGHFACGPSTVHINAMQSSAYSSAASYIGALTSCQESQLQAYADHAETAFGDSTTWDTSVVGTVGAVVGGLSASEISTLTTTQVAAIAPASISQIPVTAFSGFTVAQLSSFSVAQAQATTSAQQAALSSDQMNALIAAGAYVYAAGGANNVEMSMIILLVCAILSMYSHV